MRLVAVFDFDGTITRWDTLLPFLRRAAGSARTARALLATALHVVRSAAGGRSRDAAKEDLLGRLLAGLPAPVAEDAAEAFADHLVARRLRVDTLRRMESHRAAGHEVVIVSASPELYVAPVARRLGVDAALGTRLAVGPDGCLTGRLVGRNCRGAEKVRRLQEWLGGPVRVVAAYGDSRGDRELLAMAGDGAVWLGRRGRPRGTKRRSPP